MKPAFIVNNRNKGKWVYRAVAGALSQSVPCEILIADFSSTDNSWSEIERAVAECFRGAEHDVRLLKAEGPTESSMAEMNRGIEWMWRQTKAEWIFQCSSDDYSLKDRVKVCMEAVERNPCSAVATTQFYEDPGTVERNQVSGFPRETGYVKAGVGVERLAFGSTIGAYHREFLEKVGNCGPNTPDVLWGYLAALDKGFYVVADPQHVHCNVIDQNNVGFGGKLAAASGDELARLNELNHFQLMRLYFACAEKAKVLRQAEVPGDDWVPLINMILGQANAWMTAREALHAHKITPGVL